MQVLSLVRDVKVKLLFPAEEYLSANWPRFWSSQGHIALFLCALNLLMVVLTVLLFGSPTETLWTVLILTQIALSFWWVRRLYLVPKSPAPVEFQSSPPLLTIAIYFIMIFGFLIALILTYAYEEIAKGSKPDNLLFLTWIVQYVLIIKLLSMAKVIKSWFRATGWVNVSIAFVGLLAIYYFGLLGVALITKFVGDSSWALRGGSLLTGILALCFGLRIVWCFVKTRRSGLDSGVVLILFITWLLSGLTAVIAVATETDVFSSTSLAHTSGMVQAAILGVLAVGLYALSVDAFCWVISRFFLLPRR
jgi:hypothetical protein